jgi:hypothetical protein
MNYPLLFWIRETGTNISNITCIQDLLSVTLISCQNPIILLTPSQAVKYSHSGLPPELGNVLKPAKESTCTNLPGVTIQFNFSIHKKNEDE